MRDDAESGREAEMPCTCHPDEAPTPCERRYAYSECAAASEIRQECGSQDLHEGIYAEISEEKQGKEMIAVYRHFSSAGELLYVGLSHQPFRRHSEHLRESEWLETVSAITLQWFDNEQSAADAERLAIAIECPRWNKTTDRLNAITSAHKRSRGRPKSTKPKPWEEEGISKATWFRRKKEGK